MKLKNQAFFFTINKFVFPLLYMRHQGKKRIVYRINDTASFKIRVNSSDILVLWEVWKLKEYCSFGFSINPTDVVIDIGAHIGAFAVFAAQRARKGKVIACEPFRENYELLLENMRLNDVDNLAALNVAVSEKNGVARFTVPASNGALGSFFQEEHGEQLSVRTLTLDHLVQTHKLDRIDMLKIDAEGAEYPILFHSSQSTLKMIRHLILEYHDFKDSTYLHEELEDFLRLNGFKVATSLKFSPYNLLFGTGIIAAWR
jgi:FkbM family methyltransferase